jgi:DnaJ-class molecular chaperone
VLRGAKVPWGTIASAVADSFQVRVDASAEILRQLTDWGAHLTRNAVLVWAPAIIRPVRCSEAGCEAVSLVRCDACRGFHCLAHARISYQARAICEACVEKAAGIPRPAAPTKGLSHEEKRRKAFRTLGLTSSATFVEATAAYKKLVVRYHPDKAGTEKKRAEFTMKLKALNEAFAVVREHFDGQRKKAA